MTQGAAISAEELGNYPPVFRDAGSSRVVRAQDILLFLQSPQMEVEAYRVSVLRAVGFSVRSSAGKSARRTHEPPLWRVLALCKVQSLSG